MPRGFVKVSQTGKILPGEKRLVQVEDEQILLVNVKGSYYALSGICPHAYTLLSMGQLYEDELVCPLHGSAFNVKTGEVLSPPARANLTIYHVKIEGHDILVGPHKTQEVV